MDFLLGRCRELPVCHKVIFQKSCTVFVISVILSKGHVGIGWRRLHEKEIVSFFVSWRGTSFFSQRPASGWSWSVKLKAITLTALSKTFSSDWISLSRYPENALEWFLKLNPCFLGAAIQWPFNNTMKHLDTVITDLWADMRKHHMKPMRTVPGWCLCTRGVDDDQKLVWGIYRVVLSDIPLLLNVFGPCRQRHPSCSLHDSKIRCRIKCRWNLIHDYPITHLSTTCLSAVWKTFSCVKIFK